MVVCEFKAHNVRYIVCLNTKTPAVWCFNPIARRFGYGSSIYSLLLLSDMKIKKNFIAPISVAIKDVGYRMKEQEGRACLLAIVNWLAITVTP